jgi:hypothetical protein
MTTRYSGVVKLQGGTGSVCTAPAPNTTNLIREIVMPPQRTTLPAACAQCMGPITSRHATKFCGPTCYRAFRSVPMDTPKQCRACGEFKPRATGFAWREKRPGYWLPESKCKPCRGRQHLPRNREWGQRNADRMRLISQAGHKVRAAIKKGLMARATACESCGATGGAIEASHSDYSRPLDVTWLCRPCHRREDKQRPKSVVSHE